MRGVYSMNATAEDRVRRLAEALSAVSEPLQPLLEYAGEFRKRLTSGDEVEVVCIAALLRARASRAKDEMARSLDALEAAAKELAAP
jgi:hypothetical protein